MRAVLFVVVLLVGCFVGLIGGGYAFDFMNPPAPIVEDENDTDLEAMQRMNREQTAALKRMDARPPWFLGGAIIGAVAGVCVFMLVSRGRSESDGDESADSAGDIT